ncbi:phage tail protein, partial [Staphylococcus xylosus]
LQHYIKMVGDAAVGANRPVGEMAQIFNRVQGTGKLMTQELNMIEQGMPGFAQAMSKHLGVSQEEFRKMVTDGKVSSKEFLTVMDDFAGGMAEAYANSWSGMVKNTKAYIGIIGEQLLTGVFKESKASLKDFLEILKSDEVMEWADRTGKQLGIFFSDFLKKIKKLVTWFTNLDKSQQKLIGVITGITVVAGPLLLTVGTLLVKFAGLAKGIIGIAKAFLKASGPIAFLGKKLSLLSRFLSVLTGPVGLVIAVITLLGTAFVKAYKESQSFREFINGIGEKFKHAIDWIKRFAEAIVTLWNNESSGEKLLKKLGLDKETIDTIKFVFKEIKKITIETFNAVRNTVGKLINSIIQFFTEDGQQILEAFKNIFNGIKDFIDFIMPGIKIAFKVAWTIIKATIEAIWESIKNIVEGGLKFIKGIIQLFSGIFTGDFDKMWEGIKNIFFGALKVIWELVQIWLAGKVVKIVFKVLSKLKGFFKEGLNKIKEWFYNALVWMVKWIRVQFKKKIRSVKRSMQSIKDSIRDSMQ